MAKTNKTPLIVKWLIGEIESGNISPGSLLPTRREIMDRFGVARATADKSIASLVEQGRAFSRRGAGTFATAGQASSRRVFLVNPSQDCIDYLCPMLNGRMAYEIVQSDDLDTLMERITRPGTRLIWDRPRNNDVRLMAHMEKAVKHQLVINRRSDSMSFATTDTKWGIQAGIKQIHEWMGKDVPWGLVAAPLNAFQFFYAEREIFFYQELAKRNRFVNASVRAPHTNWQKSRRSVEKVLSKLPRRFAIYCAEMGCVPHILEASRAMHLQPGRDFAILMTDYKPEYDSTPGVFALQQDVRRMIEIAAEWALADEPAPVQELVRHTVYKGDFYGPS